jgi:hypothetical protein
VWKRKKTEPKLDPKDATRQALDFCFEDVSSMHMLGAAPLNDLASGRAPAAPASGAAPARRPSGQRWNLVVLALLVVTLAATAAATLLGH